MAQPQPPPRAQDLDLEELRRQNLVLADASEALRAERDRLVQERLQLEQDRTRMELALRGANDGWWDWDLVSGERFCSPRGFAIMGYLGFERPPDGDQWEKYIHPDDVPHVNRNFAEAIRGESEHYNVEMRLRHKQGHYVWVLSRGYILRNAQGRAIRLAGTNTDISERVRAELALKAERQLGQRIIDTSPIGICIYDRLGQCIAANDAMVRHIGGTLESVRAQNYLQLASWRATGILGLALETQRTGAPTAKMVHATSSFGKDVWLNLSFHALEPDGRLMLTTYDLSDVMRAEQMRQESEKRFDVLFLHTMDGVLQAEPGGRILAANPAACAMLGWSEDGLRQLESLQAVLDPADPRLETLFGERGVTGSARGEIFMVRQDAERFEVEMSSVVYQSPDGQALVSLLFRDIGERRRAEKAIAESERRFNSFFGESPAGLAMFDREYRWTYCNPVLARINGLPADRLVGLRPRDVFSPEMAANVEAALERTLTLGESYFNREVSGMTPAEPGVLHHWQYSQFPLLDTQGRINGVGTVVVDTTPQKRAEEALRQLNEELEQRVDQRTAEMALARDEAERANRAKSEFLSRMSHELRTPLNAILGFGQLLKLDLRDRESVDSVREILQAGQHLLQLINEVLDLARIESGKFTVSLEPVALAPLVEDCLALIRPEAQSRSIRMGAAGPDCRGLVLADRTRLKQVLLNLLSNAVKYGGAGSAVSLACVRANGTIQIRISDTGPGLNPQQQARLFVPFERLDADQSAIQGTGIGLALSKRLMEHMQGQIGVDSHPGAGSTFWVQLPLADAQAHASAPVAPPGAPEDARASRKRSTVLCIEDNPANLRLIERILARRPDVHLLSASAPGPGLELARAHHPAMILLDINLPEMDGYEVMRCLRESAATRDIPVVAISANAMPADLARGRAAGFADYLTKPLDIEQFMKAVYSILGTVNPA